MNKFLVIVSLTAFICCEGVQSSNASKKIMNSGIIVFINFLDKVRNATEKMVRDDQFRKSRTHLARPFRRGIMVQEVAENLLFPFMKMYRGTFKNETVVEFWTHVEANYLPRAPPIYSKPMDFLSYLLAKAMVKSGLAHVLKAAVDIVIETEKIDINGLLTNVQEAMSQVSENANEISALERQKEKNDFIISIRTASGLIVYYWDKLSEQTESAAFHTKYLHSIKRWAELTELKNTTEKYHVLLDPNMRQELLSWTVRHFGRFLNTIGLGLNECRNQEFGCDRFNQSNWAILKTVVVYSVPVFEKLSERGIGIADINLFLNRATNVLHIFLWNDLERNNEFVDTVYPIMYALSSIIEEEKANGKDNDLLLPLKVIRRVLLSFWDVCLFVEGFGFRHAEHQQSEREWDNMKTIFLNELMKSGELTQEKLEEAQKNFVKVFSQILEKLKPYVQSSHGSYERIEATTLALERSMLRIIRQLHLTWDIIVE